MWRWASGRIRPGRGCMSMEIYTGNGGERPCFQVYYAEKEEMQKEASAIRGTGLPEGEGKRKDMLIATLLYNG